MSMEQIHAAGGEQVNALLVHGTLPFGALLMSDSFGLC